MLRFDVYVTPRSRRAGPDGRHDGLPRLRVSSPPADGRANAEAERLLTGLLGTRVTLLGGGKARRKTYGADLDERALRRALDSAFGEGGEKA